MGPAKKSRDFRYFHRSPMAKPTPEKLAQALRANLKRRKEAPSGAKAPKPPETAPKPAQKPGFP
jgi:hypothetical protein